MKHLAISLGIRNITRNRRRSWITAAAISVGLFSMILTQGFLVGFMNYLVTAATSDFFGQGRYRDTTYEETGKHKHFIDNPQPVIDWLTTQSMVEHYTKRTLAIAMVASPENSRNVQLVGVEPKLEARFSRIKDRMTQGNFLDGKPGQVLIGSELAERLNLEVGDKLVLTTTDAVKSELVQELMRVQGIFSFASKAMDEGMVFINLKQSQHILGLNDQVHEIAVNYHDLSFINEERFPILQAQFNSLNITFETWRQFLSALKATIDMSYQSLGFIAAVLGFLVAFTVANTLYMSLYERLFEFGVMRAVGTHKSMIRNMIFFEALTLGVMGTFISLILTATLGGYLATVGVDYSGMTYNNVSLRDPIYFEFSAVTIGVYSLVTILFVGLISLYPARQILKITPCDALRERS